MKHFREVLREAVASRLDGSPVALLFSGGVDSLTVLWTLLDLGRRPRCYCFRLEHMVSADSRAARHAAEAWGVPLQMVVAPRQDVRELAADVRMVVRLIGSARKTHVEVTWAYWHLFRAAREEQVWSGLQADTLYGSSRSMAIGHGKDAAADFAAARRRLLADPGQEGLAQAVRLALHHGKVFHTPYAHERVREFLLRFSWQELNRPRQKMPAVVAFREEFGQAPVYRRSDNLQCGSGVREYVARMLHDPAVNRMGRKSVRGLYEDFLEGRA